MADMTRRNFALGAATLPFGANLSTSVRAQTNPSTSVRAEAAVIKFVVPVPPGGTLDPIARLVQAGFQEKLGVTVVVENKAGASGSIGAAQVARSAPDGNTWLFVYETQAINPFLMDLPFDSEKDLEPVQLIATAPAILATHPSRPWKDARELIAAAKAKPDSITYGSTGAGSIGHLAMTLLTERAGVRMIHTPYRGGGPAINDAIAGHVDTVVGSVALTIPQLRAKKLSGLVNFGATRAASAPDIPTAAEIGLTGVEAYAWWGVFAPRGTPQEVKDRFGKLVADILRDERNARMLSDGQYDLRLNGSAELKTFFSEQMKTWSQVIKSHGIKASG